MTVVTYRRRSGSCCGFSLIELIVVMGIIALIIAILLPTIAETRQDAMNVQCQANLRSIGQALKIYETHNRGWFFPVVNHPVTGLPQARGNWQPPHAQGTAGATMELKRRIAEAPRWTAGEVRSMLASGATVVDARMAADYAAGHIDGAINVPVSSSEAVRREALAEASKTSPIVVYCQSSTCPYAEQVAARLIADGYLQVGIYAEGWLDWSDAGKPDTKRIK